MLLESSKETGQGDAAEAAVTKLLLALDRLAASCVERAEVLQAALQQGGEAASLALTGVLEHSVEVLDAQCMSTPRRGRKKIDTMIEQVEERIESMETSGVISQLALCEESSLQVLYDKLYAVDALCDSCSTELAIDVIHAALRVLDGCLDPVAIPPDRHSLAGLSIPGP